MVAGANDELDSAIAADQARLVELAEQRAAALAAADAAAKRAAERRADLRAQLGGAPDLDTALHTPSRLAEALAEAAAAADETARAAAGGQDAAERAASTAGFGAHAGADLAGSRDGRRCRRDRGARRDRGGPGDVAGRRLAPRRCRPHLAARGRGRGGGQPARRPRPGHRPRPARTGDRASRAASQAQHAHAAAVDAHGRAQHTVGQLRLLQLDDALAALETLKERADQARQLADLAAGLGANQYRMTLSSFVLAARLEEVAKAASERLLTMTAGRYSLVHTDARRGGGKSGLGLLACDAWTGVDRDTSTLSGGETFLASLALGLADVVTAEAAGTPMEALFVDEGFGTLDEDTLDEVMNVLDGLREGGPIVGIVSHVAELRQRIPAQVHVRKGRHGSQVSVTPG